MEDFVAYTSPWKGMLATLAGCGFVAISIDIVRDSFENQSVLMIMFGFIGIILFGICALVAAYKTFNAGELVRINATGVLATPYSGKTIPWSEIEHVKTWSRYGQKSIILHLRDRARHPSRGLASYFTGLNRMITGGDVAVSLSASDRSFHEAMSAITRFRPSPAHPSKPLSSKISTG